MMIKARIGNWRIHFSMAYVYDVIGVSSNLPDGNHILMWDFDNCPEKQVEGALRVTQITHDLPNIYCLNTGKPNRYIAYCFTRLPIQEACMILADTPFIDWGFLKWGIIRNKWTLRITPKCGRVTKLAFVLTSPRPETARPEELKTWVQYETLHDQFRHSKLDQRVYIDGRRGIRRNPRQT